MEKQNIEIKFPAQFEYGGILRDFAQGIFELVKLSEEWTERLKLVLDELYNNAVEYGSDSKSQVYVTFYFDEKEVGFYVEDEGRGPEKVYPLDLDTIIKKNLQELQEGEKDGGRGLAMISRRWADQLKIENSPHGGLLVGFKKTIVHEE